MENTVILKETVNDYTIIPAAVDKSDFWRKELIYAVRLGNEFTTTKGLRTIETTVWSLTDDYIQIKGGIMIPLKSITDIHF
jgi:hypothetical protein